MITSAGARCANSDEVKNLRADGHRIEVPQPPKTDSGAELSELKISKRSVALRPAGHTKVHRWGWERFAQMMESK